MALFVRQRRRLLQPHARTFVNAFGGGGGGGGSAGGGAPGVPLISGSERTPWSIGVAMVPQQKSYVVERFGKFHKLLDPGIHFYIPVVDRIAYVHSLKEEAITIPGQTAITRDNVTINIDGVLYIRITDPHDASYGVTNVAYAVTQIAQTTMRSELGRITLDKTFEERDNLNRNIVRAINQAAASWGVECLRYEIKDITPPPSVKHAMDLQAEAERRKRADILQSEGERQSAVNLAEGRKRSSILAAEADAMTIKLRATATSEAIRSIGEELRRPGADGAARLRVAEQYVQAFSGIAKTSNTVLLPANAADPASMIAQAMAVFGATKPGAAVAAAAAADAAAAAPALSELDGGSSGSGSGSGSDGVGGIDLGVASDLDLMLSGATQRDEVADELQSFTLAPLPPSQAERSVPDGSGGGGGTNRPPS